MSETWQHFEKLTQKIQQDLAPDAQVTHNENIRGRSGVLHQCDVVVRSKVGQYDYFCIIECKDWRTTQKVDVDVVRSLKCLIDDIGATQGVVVSASDFTSVAKEYATYYGIKVYKLIDAQSVKWKDQALVPIEVGHICLRESNASMINEQGENINLVDANGQIAPHDKTYIFDKHERRYIKLKNFIEEKWDEVFAKKLPSENEIFETERDRYLLYSGDKKHIPIFIKYNFIPEIIYYYGHLSLSKCQGLIDAETGELHSKEYMTEPLNFKDVIKTWKFTKDRNEIPFKPLHTFWMGLFFSKRNSAPSEIVIHEKRD